jgi:hypothetical protein
MFGLYFEESNNFAGIIISKGLRNLQSKFSVRLTATLCHKRRKDGEEGALKTKMSGAATRKTKNDGVTARVVVHGKIDDKDEIADTLSDCGVYFQQPTASEIDPDVPYFNPHLLLRPGAQMPRIEALSISDDSTAAAGAMDEVNQGKIWRMFNQAGGCENVGDVEPSPRLKSVLKEHVAFAFDPSIEPLG